MVHMEEITNADQHISSIFTGLEPAPVRVAPQVRSAAAARSRESYELNFSVTQVLLWFLSAFSAVGLLLWAFLRLWLFEQ
jgi:hypothetical protein